MEKVPSILASIRQSIIENFTRGMRGEFLLYSTSTALMQGSKMISSLLVARILGPTDFGWWNSLQPLILYGSMLHLGVLNGMNRDVPYFTGRGDREKAELIRRVGWGITIVTALLAALLCLIGTFFVQDNPSVKSAMCFLALVVMFQQGYLYISMLLTSAIRFQLMSVQQFVQVVIFPALTISMAWLWGLNGFVLAQAIVNLVVWALMSWLSHYDLRPKFDWQETQRLGKVGFPIMAAGFLYDILRTLDRWVILYFLGPVQVGYYTLAILTLQAVTLLPSVATAQFYPRISKRFGETHSYLELKPLLKKTLVATSLLILPFGLAIFVGIRPFTQAFMQEYIPGIEAAMIVAIGVTISRPLAGASATFLNAVGRANWYMQTQVVIIAIQMAFTVGAVQMGWGLNGVAWGITLTQIINMLILVALVMRLIKLKQPKEIR